MLGQLLKRQQQRSRVVVDPDAVVKVTDHKVATRVVHLLPSLAPVTNAHDPDSQWR